MAEKPKGVYVPLDVLITDDEDILQIGMFGFALYVSGLTYAKRNKTDGFIPKAALTRLLINPTLDEEAECHAVVTQLCEIGLWEDTGTGYAIRSWEQWNPTDGDREKWAERKRKQREGTPNEGHSVAVTPLSRDVTEAVTPSHAMSRLEGKGIEGKGSKELVRVLPFDEFWKVYPRREGKGAARKAFTSAVRRGGLTAIVAGAERYAADPNREPAFTAHPATWLNRDGWDDDPLPARTQAKRSPGAEFARQAMTAMEVVR